MFDVDQVVEELLGNNHEGFCSARVADEWLCEENLTEVHGEGSDVMEKARLLAEWIDGNVPDAIEKGILRFEVGICSNSEYIESSIGHLTEEHESDWRWEGMHRECFLSDYNDKFIELIWDRLPTADIVSDEFHGFHAWNGMNSHAVRGSHWYSFDDLPDQVVEVLNELDGDAFAYAEERMLQAQRAEVIDFLMDSMRDFVEG